MWITLCLLYFVASTPLDDYVNEPDSHYEWNVMDYTLSGSDFNGKFVGHVLNMTSQKWLDETVIDRPIWRHALVVIEPEQIRYPEHALLYITGGGNDQFPHDWTNQELQMVMQASRRIGCIGAVLFQIPNEPLYFADQDFKIRRSEDAIIAKTWELFIRDPTFTKIPLRNPMVKAAVRAMDTVTEYVAQITKNHVSKFAVAGASKRGWTTWLTAAVDKRVVAFMPIVLSVLNFQKNLHHYYESYNGWPFAFEDYYKVEVTKDLDTPEVAELMDIVDPYVYRDRLTQPKVIVSSTNDQFFTIDDAHYYYKDLPGEKHIYFPKNTEHSTATGIKQEAWTMATFLDMVFGDEPRPQMEWEIDSKAGTTKLMIDQKPKWVRLHWVEAVNKTRRDFRVASLDNPCSTIIVSNFCVQPNIYQTEKLETKGKNEAGQWIYEGRKEPPSEGYLAFYLQAKFEREGLEEGRPNSLRLSTEMNIIPDGFPFPDCEGQGCQGVLV